jgi:hypothetical protein
MSHTYEYYYVVTMYNMSGGSGAATVEHFWIQSGAGIWDLGGSLRALCVADRILDTLLGILYDAER